MRNLYKIIAGILFLIFVSAEVAAQDARFAQFYTSPTQLNPALTGVFDGQYRFTANYRSLYSSILGRESFKTLAASAELRHRVNRSGDFAGFGINFLKDEVGIAEFSRFQSTFGASYMKQMGGGGYRSADQYLIAGAQFGIGQRGFDWGKLWFSQQFDQAQAVVDYGAASGENFPNDKTRLYIDFNAGLLWYATFDENMSMYFGGAIHHLNTPNISFLDEADEKLYSRYTIHAGGEVPFTDQLSFMPAIAFMKQGPSLSTTVGGNFRYTNRDWRELAIRAGVWGHVANKLDKGMEMDALIFTAILETGPLNIGVSYDVTTSLLSNANNSRGAFELSMIYTSPPKNKRYAVECPRL